jgi:Protein of unknown function with PCYCGC motif
MFSLRSPRALRLLCFFAASAVSALALFFSRASSALRVGRVKYLDSMGRKSSAKAQGRDAAAPPPSAPKRPFSPLLVFALVAVAAVVGVFAFMRTGPQSDQDSTASSPAQQQTPAEVPAINQKPHPQAAMPPLPFSPSPPARPAEVVRAVYKFAAEHPEVLSYVPCYCGCERSGHRGNEDCFVTARNEQGDVTDWEPHGMT